MNELLSRQAAAPDHIGASGETSVWMRLWPALAAAAALVAFHSVGAHYFRDYALDLGSLTLPTPLYALFGLFWVVLGSLGALAVALCLWRVAQSLSTSATGGSSLDRDKSWIIGGTLCALIIPVAVRVLVLRGAPVTDDESSYRFAAQLLAGGRLWTPSHPLKLFFDRQFMINDGKFYSQYFIGWPLLMVPGIWLGLGSYINALYAALTVPPLFLAIRQLADSLGARVALAAYLTSPLLMVGAATEMSHTSCVCALSWALWLLLLIRRDASRWWLHAGFAFALGLAFLIRPFATMGLGLPLGLAWAARSLRRPGRAAFVALASFAVPALGLAAVFLLVNRAQNGSALLTGYDRAVGYLYENNFRFSTWRPDTLPKSVSTYLFSRSGVVAGLARSAVALVRLNFDLFGWPCSLLFPLLAAAFGGGGIVWAMFGCAMGLNALMPDAGVDSFGPVHYSEVALPLIVLLGLAVARLRQWAQKRLVEVPPQALSTAAVALFGGLIVTSAAGYTTVRLRNLERIAGNVNAPFDAAEAAGLSKAVVFSPLPFVQSACIRPTSHFVFFRPNNRPDLHDDILWVNDVGRQQDAELMKHFPGRSGYRMSWGQDCKVRFTPLQARTGS